MVDLQRHEKFYDLFKQNGWNGLLNVHGTPVNLPVFYVPELSKYIEKVKYHIDHPND